MAGLRRPEADVGALRAPMRSCLAVLGLFAALLLALALLERLGIQSGRIPQAVAVGASLLSLVVAFVSHGRRPADYYVADGIVVARLNGLAGASGIVGLLVIGLSAESAAAPDERAAALGGLLAGLVVAAVLVAPRLRRVGGYTTGDFYAARFGGGMRLAAAVAAWATSSLLLVACLKTAGPLLAGLLGIDSRLGTYIAGALIALAILPGGMRALTWTKIFQYLIIVFAAVLPAAWLAVSAGVSMSAANPDAVAAPAALLGAVSGMEVASVAPPLFLFMSGAVALPVFLARTLVAPSPSQAAASVYWMLLFAIVAVAAALVLGGSLFQATGLAPIGPSGDFLAWSMPLFAALPSVLVGAAVAGVLMALLALGQTALFSAVSAVSHDLWNVVFGRGSAETRRIFLANLLTVAFAAAAAWLSARWPIAAATTVGWAFAVSAASGLVPLLAALWWPRTNPIGAVLGTATGFGIAAFVLLIDLDLVAALGRFRPGGGYGPAAAASLALPAALLVTIVASLFGRVMPRSESVPPERASSLAEADKPA